MTTPNQLEKAMKKAGDVYAALGRVSIKAHIAELQELHELKLAVKKTNDLLEILLSKIPDLSPPYIPPYPPYRINPISDVVTETPDEL